MSTKKSSAKDEVRFNLRLPSDLHDEVVSRAVANGRSMNGEIVAILSAVLEGGQDVTETALIDEWTRLRQRLEVQEREVESIRERMAWLDGQIAQHHLKASQKQSD